MSNIIKGAIIITVSSLLISGCGATSGATSIDEQKKPTVQTQVVSQKSSVDTTNLNGFVNGKYLVAGAALKNTDNTIVEINSVQFNFEAKDGSILTTSQNNIPAPSILKPGETAYVGDYKTLENIDKSKFKQVTINIDYKPTDKKHSEWKFDHLKADKQDFGGIKVSGKITNAGKEKSNEILINAALLDKEGKVLAVVQALNNTSLDVGESSGFEADGHFLPTDILGKVASIQAAAVTANQPSQ